jgi:hypothetical protein
MFHDGIQQRSPGGGALTGAVNDRPGGGLTWRVAVVAVVLTLPVAAAAQPGVPARASLCAAVDKPPADVARALEPLGDTARTALLALATSSTLADAACGVSGLAALRDRRVVEPVRAALKNPAFRDDAYRFARWAAYVAGGPEPDLGVAVQPLVEVLADPAVWKAAGADAIRLLGEIDHPSARDRLAAELNQAHPDTTLDALIHALARQGEPRVHARVVALGQEGVAGRSGNLTYEQASRIGSASFYLLAVGPDTRTAGLELLRQMAPDYQADTAAWAAQTWCERAARRPAERDAALAQHERLAAEFDGMNIRWRELVRGSFPCPAPTP